MCSLREEVKPTFPHLAMWNCDSKTCPALSTKDSSLFFEIKFANISIKRECLGVCVLGRPKNSRVINKLAQQIVRIPNFRSEKQLVRLGVEMIYLVSVSARLQSSFFFYQEIPFV